MSDHDPQTEQLAVDELWIAEWAAAGIEAAEGYLAKHAAFAEFLNDGDCRADD